MNWKKTNNKYQSDMSFCFFSWARKRVGKRLWHYCPLQNAPKCIQQLFWLMDCISTYHSGRNQHNLLLVQKKKRNHKPNSIAILHHPLWCCISFEEVMVSTIQLVFCWWLRRCKYTMESIPLTSQNIRRGLCSFVSVCKWVYYGQVGQYHDTFCICLLL